MRTSQKAIDLIKAHEMLKLKAYFCPSGIPTIGFGHTKTVTKQDVKSGKAITKEEAQRLFDQDLAEAEATVSSLGAILTINQFSALVSFVFNVGPTKFLSSTMAKHLRAGNMDKVPMQFPRWVYGTDPKTQKKYILPGLIRRRRDEMNLFLLKEQ
jgi:lysozyme